MTPAIEFRHVEKRYGTTAVLTNLSLAIQTGEMMGFLGPNGAGKTSTIRLMTGFLKPTSGSIQVLGRDPIQARAQLGYVPDVAGLDPGTSGNELLRYLERLQGQPAVDRPHLVESLELAQRDLARPIRELSRGTRQKINLIQGLQHRPDLLILDEPTEGLDPLAKYALFQLLRAAQTRGATIFFSSHVLSEVESLCDRVALIRRGELVAVDSIGRLRAQLRRRVLVTLAEDRDVSAEIHALPTVDEIVIRGREIAFVSAEMPATLQLLARLPVADVTIAPPSLEDLFLRYYSPDSADE